MDFQIITNAAEKKLRPTIPATCPSCIRDLVDKMWSHEPDQRPDFSKCLSSFAAAHGEYQADKEKWNALIPATPIQTENTNKQ